MQHLKRRLEKTLRRPTNIQHKSKTQDQRSLRTKDRRPRRWVVSQRTGGTQLAHRSVLCASDNQHRASICSMSQRRHHNVLCTQLARCWHTVGAPDNQQRASICSMSERRHQTFLCTLLAHSWHTSNSMSVTASSHSVRTSRCKHIVGTPLAHCWRTVGALLAGRTVRCATPTTVCSTTAS